MSKSKCVCVRQFYDILNETVSNRTISNQTISAKFCDAIQGIAVQVVAKLYIKSKMTGNPRECRYPQRLE